MSGYTQLTQGQRYQMEALHKIGHNQTMIANVLAVHHSYSSWERGLSEHTNGLIRQYLPKSQPLNNVTQK
jgi:IS30 family transposase